MLINLNILFPTIIFFLLCLIIPKILNNLNLLKNNLNKDHNINSQVASISGGICLIIALFVFTIIDKNSFYTEYAILIFLIGLLSDTNIVQSPKQRLSLIIIVISLFSVIENFSISSTNILYVDQLLKFSNLFTTIFFVFCLSILINGCNFIDGTNNNLNFYFLYSNVIILLLKINFEVDVDFNIFLIFISLSFTFFNFFDRIFFGDSGAYLIGFLIGIDLIYLFNLNSEISKFFAILIFFYPCFEVLFSMIRKYSFKHSPFYADKNHLHTILVNFLIRQKKEKKIAHLVSSFFLNTIFFIPVILLYNQNKYYHTKNILISILILVSIYLILFHYFKKKIK